MLSFFDPIRGIEFKDIVIKLLLAVLFGGIIGIERSYKNRPAGFRTHILVTLGASVASLSGIFLAKDMPADVSRIGAAVVSGLGFLGAGTIIVTKNFTVKGLTTAAGLWTSGIIGLAIGAGFYEGAILASLLVLLAEIALGELAHSIRRDPEFRLEILFHEKSALDQVMRVCKNRRLSITKLQVVADVWNDKSCYRGFVSLRPRTTSDKERLFREISEVDGVLEFKEVDMKDEG